MVPLPPVHFRTSAADGADQCGRGRCRRLPVGSRNDRAQLVTLYTNDLFYSDPSLRREVTGRNVSNCCLEQPPKSVSVPVGHNTVIRHAICADGATKRAGQTAPNSPIC